MTPREITAKEMAKKAGVGPQRFRNALRKANLPWHTHYDRWTVRLGSPQHRAMERVLNRL